MPRAQLKKAVDVGIGVGVVIAELGSGCDLNVADAERGEEFAGAGDSAERNGACGRRRK